MDLFNIILFSGLNIIWIGILIGAYHFNDKKAMMIAGFMLVLNIGIIGESWRQLNYTPTQQIEVIE